jgi:hypothetical protein
VDCSQCYTTYTTTTAFWSSTVYGYNDYLYSTIDCFGHQLSYIKFPVCHKSVMTFLCTNSTKFIIDSRPLMRFWRDIFFFPPCNHELVKLLIWITVGAALGISFFHDHVKALILDHTVPYVSNVTRPWNSYCWILSMPYTILPNNMKWLFHSFISEFQWFCIPIIPNPNWLMFLHLCHFKYRNPKTWHSFFSLLPIAQRNQQ